MGHIIQPKKQFNIQIIGILEDIDSFYWPKIQNLVRAMTKGKRNFYLDNFPEWYKNEKVCYLHPQMFVCYGVVLDTPTLHQNVSFANTELEC